jgi:hypothetical protein
LKHIKTQSFLGGAPSKYRALKSQNE